MDTTVVLQDIFVYSGLLIIVAAILIVIAIAAFIGIKPALKAYRSRPPKMIAVTEGVQVQAPKNPYEIQHRYLAQLDTLAVDFAGGLIEPKEAYKSLSRIARQFAYEMTGISFTEHTLAEVRAVGIAPLTALMEEYTDPEFALNAESNVALSIEHTREVISTWI